MKLSILYLFEKCYIVLYCFRIESNRLSCIINDFFLLNYHNNARRNYHRVRNMYAKIIPNFEQFWSFSLKYRMKQKILPFGSRISSESIYFSENISKIIQIRIFIRKVISTRLSFHIRIINEELSFSWKQWLYHRCWSSISGIYHDVFANMWL